VRYAIAIALLALGCGPGPSDETLIDELQVVGAIVEPPEIGPGEDATVEVVVADPLGTGADVLVWSCTGFGAGCLEAPAPLPEWAAVGSLEDEQLVIPWTASPALGALLEEGETAEAGLWVLACEPGLCAVIDEVRAALDDGGAAPDALVADLADPFAWVADLPIDGVSLAQRSLVLSARPQEQRNTNPVIDVRRDGPTTVSPGQDLELPIEVSDDGDTVELAFGLATGGGFGLPSFDVLDGEAILRWYAPDETGEVDLFVVVNDGEGGTAVWRERALVSDAN
jgi:hypothetical protein